MLTAQVDGKTVKVGDYVSFKSDYEQTGKIVQIKHANWGNGKVLVLANSNGFGGDYLRGAETTEELASDCWVD